MKNYYLDLFSGIGGFALGAYWAGMKFDEHYFSEIEKYPSELYQKRFPDSVSLGDITKINYENLPKGNWIIAGGFPCQDISVAGKQKGMIDEKGNKTRSGLWFEFYNAIRLLQPRFTVIENVGALTRNGLDTVLSNLAEIGYDAEWQDIRAEDLGAPHKRERIWIIAYPSKNGFYETENGQSNNKGNDDSTAGKETTIESERCHIPRDISYSKSIRRFQNKNEIRNTFKAIKNRGCPIDSIYANATSKDAYSRDFRVINDIPRTMDRLKGLGNAIVPQIAELLFNLIKQDYYDKA